MRKIKAGAEFPCVRAIDRQQLGDRSAKVAIDRLHVAIDRRCLCPLSLTRARTFGWLGRTIGARRDRSASLTRSIGASSGLRS